MDRLAGEWLNPNTFQGLAYECGFCNREIAADRGYLFVDINGFHQPFVRLCPHCNRPSFFEGDRRWPSPGFGDPVDHLPPEVEVVWTEARDATAAGCSTAAVLLLRKLLMHIAVDLGADEGKSFVDYVTYLAEQHVIAPQASGWVDEIRQQGNEKNHEIKVSTPDEARDLMVFMEYLLRGLYEFPGELKAKQATP